MTYKNCIHNEICIFRGKGDCPDNCAQFKDKARFVELPCKVGDTVHILGHRFPCEIEKICIEEDGLFFEYVEYERSPELTELWDDGTFEPKEIGKTVFLTWEEAEKALENMKNERR